MKTKGMAHQLEGVSRALASPLPGFALFCEQGTGKTWMFLQIAETHYAQGRVDAMLVVAPKGVHINWVKREIPKHLEVPHVAVWFSSNSNKKQTADLERLYRPRDEGEVPPLRILAINYEALLTKKGFAAAQRFLNATRAMAIADESQRIKNPRSGRSQAMYKLRHRTVLRYPGTGTPITNSPLDAFGQFEFIDSGLLGTTSFRAYTAEYADLVPENSRLMDHVKKRISNNRFMPQIVQRDALGRKKWRNLDKLQSIIAPLSYRVLKKDCLDLPEKIFNTHYFELTPELHRIYHAAEKQLRIEVGGDSVMFRKLNVDVKLQQITSGFILHEGHPILLEDNPRLASLLDFVDDIEGKFIVWARFVEEIEQIHRALTDRGITSAKFYGATKDAARTKIVDDFQDGDLRAIVAQPQSGGVGLTLTAASNVMYYSNDWSLENRLQSEDRAHRIGTRHNVVYTDFAATDTIDEKIALALQEKQDVAATVLGDWRASVTSREL